MGWWQVSADTLARSRFVISPLAETTASLLALERGTAAHPGERRWLDAHQDAYRGYVKDHPDVPRLIRLSLGLCWIPGVITVAPAGDDEQAFGDELAQILSVSPAIVADDLEALGIERYPDDLPAKAADLLEWVWANTVRPYWPERRKIIEADIVARTTQLGRGGWAAALSDMRPGLRWLGEGRLQINAYENPPREISGAQLLFVPVTPTAGWVAWEEPLRYAVMYPCSGRAGRARPPGGRPGNAGRAARPGPGGHPHAAGHAQEHHPAGRAHRPAARLGRPPPADPARRRAA